MQGTGDLGSRPRVVSREPRVLGPGDPSTLAPYEERAGEMWVDADLEGRDLTGVTIADCLIRSVRLSETILRSAQVIDTRLDEGYATSLRASRSLWRGVHLDRLRIGSAELFDADLVSVRWASSKVDDLNGRGARWTDVLLVDCTITTLDLAGARLERVAFERCRIGTLELSGTNCTDVDLRTTNVGHVNGSGGMRGVIIDAGQLIELAPMLARDLGIFVAYADAPPTEEPTVPTERGA